MYTMKILFCLAVIGLQHFWAAANTSSYQPQQARSINDNGDKQITVSSASVGSSSVATADGPLMNALYRKSRQSRCVRCYDDRYPSTDRGGYGSGYSSRAVDDRSSTSNWYYPTTYDRYDDRYRTGTADYDRYYRDRDDRYGSRGYDRYDTRGGSAYDTRGSTYDRYDTRYDDRRAPVYDRYDDRRGDYGESRGSAYEPRDRYAGYGAADYRDRYYDRYRGGSSGSSVGYDRDYYDRYYSRYDYRNYRPWDETYSSTYGSRPPPRPLTVSYLFDRDSNAITKESNGSSSQNAAESAAEKTAANEGSGASSMMLTGDKPATAASSAGQN